MIACMADTIFTRIVRGELPSSKVYEDDQCIAIMDINAVHKGHVLVIPKEDYPNVYELPEDLFMHLMKVAKHLALAVKKATGAEGINIIMNNEPAAGQVITDHAHIHIVPRFVGDGLQNWAGKQSYEDGEKDAYAEKITAALAD